MNRKRIAALLAALTLLGTLSAAASAEPEAEELSALPDAVEAEAAPTEEAAATEEALFPAKEVPAPEEPEAPAVHGMEVGLTGWPYYTNRYYYAEVNTFAELMSALGEVGYGDQKVEITVLNLPEEFVFSQSVDLGERHVNGKRILIPEGVTVRSDGFLSCSELRVEGRLELGIGNGNPEVKRYLEGWENISGSPAWGVSLVPENEVELVRCIAEAVKIQESGGSIPEVRYQTAEGGELTLSQDLTIPAGIGVTLGSYSSPVSLTVPAGVTLMNLGDISFESYDSVLTVDGVLFIGKDASLSVRNEITVTGRLENHSLSNNLRYDCIWGLANVDTEDSLVVQYEVTDTASLLRAAEEFSGASDKIIGYINICEDMTLSGSADIPAGPTVYMSLARLTVPAGSELILNGHTQVTDGATLALDGGRLTNRGSLSIETMEELAALTITDGTLTNDADILVDAGSSMTATGGAYAGKGMISLMETALEDAEKSLVGLDLSAYDMTQDGKHVRITPKEVPALFGDCDGDGEVTPYDWAYLSRALAGWSGYGAPEPAVGDLSGDGVVNRTDRVCLARTLIG